MKGKSLTEQGSNNMRAAERCLLEKNRRQWKGSVLLKGTIKMEIKEDNGLIM